MQHAVLAFLMVMSGYLVHPVCAADIAIRPCESETAKLMNISSSWGEVFKAAIALPPACFDGYFAEGISDTLVRKMGKDWQGFQTLLNMYPDETRFMNLVLRSITATLDPNDIRTVDRLASTACHVKTQNHCRSISREVAAALAEYDPPELRNVINPLTPELAR